MGGMEKKGGGGGGRGAITRDRILVFVDIVFLDVPSRVISRLWVLSNHITWVYGMSQYLVLASCP